MPLCFRSFVTFAVPGALALLGCWWIYSRGKKHGTYQEEPAVGAEEQQEEVTEQDSAPGAEPCVPQRQLSWLQEEDTEDKTSTSLLTAGLTMPSVICQSDERLDLSPNLAVTTNQPSALEKDSETLQETRSQDEKSVPCTSTCEGGACVEGPLQNTMLAVASGQHSELLSLPASRDTSAGQSSGPSETQPPLKLPEDTEVPYSTGVLREDGPEPCNECSKAPGIDGGCPQGSDDHSMDFVNSGCAMKKAVTQQNTETGRETSKCDHVIWEIEVPEKSVGRLIGWRGKFVSFLRQESGAKIYVRRKPYLRDSQVCYIEGSPRQVEKGLSLIGRKFKELCLANVHNLPPPAPLTFYPLLPSAWLFLPDGVSVEVIVAHQVDAGHMFLQQPTHPTFHVLRSLEQQMSLCYSEPKIPTLPTPVEAGIICAAPGLDGAWLRAQVISYFAETSEVQLRYVDYGGYDKVKVNTLRHIRSDFLSLPFQAAEVFLDNVVPLPDEDRFSPEADAAVGEMTRGAVLVAQVTNYDSATGLPLIQLWNLMGDQVVSVNRALVERGLARWLDY